MPNETCLFGVGLAIAQCKKQADQRSEQELHGPRQHQQRHKQDCQIQGNLWEEIQYFFGTIYSDCKVK